MEKLNLFNRVVHLTASGFLAGTVILNYFFGTHDFLAEDPNYLDFALPFAGVATMATGLVSIYILKPKDGDAKTGKAGAVASGVETVDPKGIYSVWGDLVKVKFAVSLLLTPLVDPLVMLVLSFYETAMAGEGEEAVNTLFDDNEEMALAKAKSAQATKVSIQFWVVVVLMLLSFATKVFREDYCNSFRDDPVNNKLEEIK